jgi:beta-glucosidase
LKDSKNGSVNFPDGFLWGTATSPTQVEGHIQNEWTDFVAVDGGNCNVACDHYHRYPEDVQWMGKLGVNAYRMGIEWSRLQAAPFAPLNKQELDRYCDLLEQLKAAGIEPMVVLHHFSNPPWVNAIGGWVNGDVVPMFVDYVTKLVDVLKHKVRIWNTFNEPDTYASLAYVLGGFPPNMKWKIHSFRKVIGHMAKAHFRASRVIRRNVINGIKPQVGIAKNWTFFEPFRKFVPWDYLPAALCHYGFNRFVTDAFLGGWRRKASTYLGLNYYGRVRFRHLRPLIPCCGASGDLLKSLDVICDDMIERHVPGFEVALKEFHQKYRLPIYITEHGSASSDEKFRIRDLSEHLQILQRAMSHGVDVRGFFYWSLMDNFEWQFGYTKKFGLLSVDFKDEKLPRRMTAVGEYYQGICTNRQLAKSN